MAARRRDEDPEYQEFLNWRKNNRNNDDGAEEEEDDDLDDGDEDQADEDDDEGGVAVLTGKRADAFIERMFGPSEPRRKKATKRQPEPQDDEDDEEPDEDPEPVDRGHRFFRGRTGRG